MPFVRISLNNKFDQETLDNISTAIHLSLIEIFHIPQDDFFQVVETYDHSHIKFPASYLGITHSDDIVFIQITAARGRTPEQKQQLYKQVAERIEATTSIGRNNVFIVLLENNGEEDWSFGNGEIQEMKHLKK